MPTANPEMILSAAIRVASKLSAIGATHESVDAFIKGKSDHPVYVALEEHFAPKPQVALPALFKSSETNLDEMITAAEVFAKKHFGITVDLRTQFVIPESLPWKKVLVVFDPGNLTNRDAVDKVLRDLGLAVWEETDVMNYSGAKSNGAPSLHIIALSTTPDKDTMGLSPNDLRKTGKSYLGLRSYTLAFALHHSMTSEHLDPKETFTWFPENRLSGGLVAYGSWRPSHRKVGFRWSCADDWGPHGGARVAMSVSLRS